MTYILETEDDIVIAEANLIKIPSGIINEYDMFEAMKSNYDSADYVICAAAIADYTPATFANHKIKKSDDDLAIALDCSDINRLNGFASYFENAKVKVETYITNKTDAHKVHVVLKDATGTMVAGVISDDTTVELEIKGVHRWHGRKDPYLYTCEVELIESMSENTNIIVEENNELVKLNLAHSFSHCSTNVIVGTSISAL